MVWLKAGILSSLSRYSRQTQSSVTRHQTNDHKKSPV